jgi:hypothetical protein
MRQAGIGFAAALTGLLVAAVAGCGGGSSATPTSTIDPHPPRAVAPGYTITHVETGTTPIAGSQLPQLRTAAAARRDCSAQPAPYLAWTYGIASDRLPDIARVFATRRAAPGHLAEVRAGCRAGLYK